MSGGSAGVRLFRGGRVAVVLIVAVQGGRRS